MFTVKAYKIYFKKDIKYLTNYLFWVSLIAQLVKNPPAMQETPVWFLGQEDPLEKGKATHSDLGLENSMDCIVHRVAKSQTRLSNFHFFSLSCTFQTECCCTINRLQYSMSITLNALGTKKITGLTLFWYLLFSSSLELNPQYLWGMSV